MARKWLLICGFLPAVFAQHRVDMRNTYYRLLCVVPITGKGTAADPRRPEYAPAPVRGGAPPRTGIVAFTWVAADDGKNAVVEFVARDRVALQAILADKRPTVKVFERGKHSRAAILQELRKHKGDIDLDRFGVAVP